MNTLLRVVFAAVLASGLGACASTQSSAITKASASPASAGATNVQSRTDVRYVATVEHAARRRGVQVYWLNPPQKKASLNQ